MSDKILFQCDYNEGAHPKVLERLVQTNMEQTPGYSEDKYCEEAREKIRKACGDDSLAVHFLVGGTQTNVTVINAALRKHQGVLCAVTGHINVHETGAVEACGHKVLGLPSPDGKITAAQSTPWCLRSAALITVTLVWVPPTRKWTARLSSPQALRIFSRASSQYLSSL